MPMVNGTSILVFAVALSSAGLVPAKDVFYDLPVRDLKLVEGRLPNPPDNSGARYYQRMPAMEPYAVLDGTGEAYLTGPGTEGTYWSRVALPATSGQPDTRVQICAPE